MAANSAIRVFVVDRHELMRAALVDLLQERGLRVVGQAARGSDAIALAGQLVPDVVLLDLSLPDMPGVEATRRLLEEAPGRRLVVLTVMAEERIIVETLHAGASGYLLKDSSIESIVASIEAAARGESVLSPRVASRIIARLVAPPVVREAPSWAELSEREIEVLQLLTRGTDNREIGHTLFLSEHTVKSHVSRILEKLGAENRVQAAVSAIRYGIV